MLDDWLSYSLTDFVPITMDVYVHLFSRVNANLWPLTIVAALVGVMLIILVSRQHLKYALLLLTAAWCFCAYQFHFKLLSELNWIAYYFALLFLLQAALILLFFILNSHPKEVSQNQQKFGLLFMLASMFIFLMIPAFNDRSWQSIEIFSIAPNPTSLMTIGTLIALNIRSWWLYLIPSSWSLMSLIIDYSMRVS